MIKGNEPTLRSSIFPTISTNNVVRPTLVEVNLDRLTENFQAIRRKVAPARVMAPLSPPLLPKPRSQIPGPITCPVTFAQRAVLY